MGETQLIKCAKNHDKKKEKAESCTKKMLALKSNYINYNACRSNLCFALTLVQKLERFWFFSPSQASYNIPLLCIATGLLQLSL